MKFKDYNFIFFFIIILNFNFVKSEEINLEKKFIPLKDFIVLKYDLFLKHNISEIFRGGGFLNVAYQEVNYNVNINEKNTINISITGVMNKERYKVKKYYPKLSDCNQIRNKIFVKKYGYSFFKQTLNYAVNEENLSEVINNEILNISSLDKNLKQSILDNTIIKIKVIHPKKERNINCSGKITSVELK